MPWVCQAGRADPRRGAPRRPTCGYGTVSAKRIWHQRRWATSEAIQAWPASLSAAAVAGAGVAMRAAASRAAHGHILAGHARLAALLVFGPVADGVAAWRPGALVLGPALAIAALVGLVRTARVTTGGEGAKSLAHALPVAALLVVAATGGATGRPGPVSSVPAGAVTPLPAWPARVGILVVALAGGSVVLLPRVARIGGAQLLLGTVD